jgi:hypothetical protein
VVVTFCHQLKPSSCLVLSITTMYHARHGIC